MTDYCKGTSFSRRRRGLPARGAYYDREYAPWYFARYNATVVPQDVLCQAICGRFRRYSPSYSSLAVVRRMGPLGIGEVVTIPQADTGVYLLAALVQMPTPGCTSGAGS